MLVTHKIKVPLLHHWGYLAGIVIIVSCRLLQLGRIVDCLSSLAVYIALSKTMRAGPPGGGFQIIYSLIPPSPMSEVCSNSI